VIENILTIISWGEIKKKPAKHYITIQRGVKLRKPPILVVN
jgi:hypothetical protein